MVQGKKAARAISPLASPRGLKEAVGVTVLVESMKLRDAQKIPERTLLSSFQDLSTLEREKNLLTLLGLHLCNSKYCVASVIQPQLTAKSMAE